MMRTLVIINLRFKTFGLSGASRVSAPGFVLCLSLRPSPPAAAFLTLLPPPTVLQQLHTAEATSWMKHSSLAVASLGSVLLAQSLWDSVSLVSYGTSETAPECKGWICSSDGPSTAPLSPLWSRHYLLTFTSKLPSILICPVTQRPDYKAPREQRSKYPKILPLPSHLQLLQANVKEFCTRCCLSQAICTHSLISLSGK